MTRNKKILMVRQTGLAGAQNIVSLCNVMSCSGYEVALLVLDGTSERHGLDSRIELIVLSGAAGRFAASRALRKKLMNDKYDIVYVIDSWTIPAYWLATWGSMRVKGKPLVYHTFDWLEPGQVGWWRMRLEKAICLKADLVVNADRARARMQRTLYGLDDTPMWLQNALSCKMPLPSRKDSVREEMLGRRVSKDERIIIYPTVVSAGDSGERCVPNLIRAAAKLPETHSVLLFGREGAEMAKCRQLIGELGVTDKVRFLAPVVFDKLVEYVGSSDFGVILYNDEKSSGYFMCNADKMSLFAACGVPYLASSFPNLEAITYKYSLGVCCDSGDPGAIAEGFRNLSEKFVNMPEDGQRIRTVFEEHICLERYIGILADAMDGL